MSRSLRILKMALNSSKTEEVQQENVKISDNMADKIMNSSEIIFMDDVIIFPPNEKCNDANQSTSNDFMVEFQTDVDSSKYPVTSNIHDVSTDNEIHESTPNDFIIELEDNLGIDLQSSACQASTTLNSDSDFLPEDERSATESNDFESGEENEKDGKRSDDKACNKENINKKRKVKGRNKRHENKKLRLLGKTYVGFRRPAGQTKTFQDMKRNERKMGPRCISNGCKKSTVRKCNNIKDHQRQKIFNFMWEKMNWDQRKVYVLNTVQCEGVGKSKEKDKESRRKVTLKYFLKVENTVLPVCKNMYLNTLGLGEWTVRSWALKSNCGMAEQNETMVAERARASRQQRIKSEDRQFLETFLDKLNKLPSHYCRKDTTKLYLEQTFVSKADLYRVYKEVCSSENKIPLNITVLTSVQKEMNISLFSPKKDQCDLCFEHKVGNIPDEIWQKHIAEKERARLEKSTDKEQAIAGNVNVITVDLQAVKLCPKVEASGMYFKTKLACHNFTCYNLKNNHATCYWFTEVDADLQASTFATCLVDYLERHLLGEKKPIIIWSDGCTYQNRNAIMANALSHLVLKHNVEITQKYLIKGHTQMECDSVHATIERRLKNAEINLPSDYCRFTKQARQNPAPYEVVDLSFDFFTDYTTNMHYESIRPGKKPTEPTVVDIRVLHYLNTGIIQYKTNFDMPLTEVPQRIKKVEANPQFAKLFKDRLPIKKTKFDHLQILKRDTPKDCWYFYDNLPWK